MTALWPAPLQGKHVPPEDCTYYAKNGLLYRSYDGQAEEMLTASFNITGDRNLGDEFAQYAALILNMSASKNKGVKE